MTELDPQTLRRALRAPEDGTDPVDVAMIVRRGRSLRRRRRLAAAVGGACAAAALFGALTAITHLTRPASGPAHYPAVSGRTASASAPTPSPRHPLPTVSPSQSATPEPAATPKATPTAVPEPTLTGRKQVYATASPRPSGVTAVPSAGDRPGTPSPTASR